MLSTPYFLLNLSIRPSVNQLLLASVERMALGANFYVDFRFGGTGYKSVATVAGNGCLIILGMDSFFHFFHLLNHTCYHVLDIADYLLHNIRILSYHIKKFKHFFDFSDKFLSSAIWQNLLYHLNEFVIILRSCKQL